MVMLLPSFSSWPMEETMSVPMRTCPARIGRVTWATSFFSASVSWAPLSGPGMSPSRKMSPSMSVPKTEP